MLDRPVHYKLTPGIGKATSRQVRPVKQSNKRSEPHTQTRSATHLKPPGALIPSTSKLGSKLLVLGIDRLSLLVLRACFRLLLCAQRYTSSVIAPPCIACGAIYSSSSPAFSECIPDVDSCDESGRSLDVDASPPGRSEKAYSEPAFEWPLLAAGSPDGKATPEADAVSRLSGSTRLRATRRTQARKKCAENDNDQYRSPNTFKVDKEPQRKHNSLSLDDPCLLLIRDGQLIQISRIGRRKLTISQQGRRAPSPRAPTHQPFRIRQSRTRTRRTAHLAPREPRFSSSRRARQRDGFNRRRPSP